MASVSIWPPRSICPTLAHRSPFRKRSAITGSSLLKTLTRLCRMTGESRPVTVSLNLMMGLKLANLALREASWPKSVEEIRKRTTGSNLSKIGCTDGFTKRLLSTNPVSQRPGHSASGSAQGKPGAYRSLVPNFCTFESSFRAAYRRRCPLHICRQRPDQPL
jgi:hypothetical protein